jgi:hypothetical protein
MVTVSFVFREDTRNIPVSELVEIRGSDAELNQRVKSDGISGLWDLHDAL